MTNFIERPKPTTTVKALMNSVPYVLIHADALAKMYHYVQECSDEIGWMGTAYMEGREITIKDVYLFDQEVHSTTTEITPEGLSNFAMELMQQPDGVEVWNNLKMWGHSHVNMGITPSGQDDLQMEKFKEGGHDWFIRLIANKKGDMKLDFYDYANGLIFLDVPWYEQEDAEQMEIAHAIRQLELQLTALKTAHLAVTKEPIVDEMKVKVRKKSYATHTHGSNWAQRGNQAGTTKTSTATGTKKIESATGKDVKKNNENNAGNKKSNVEQRDVGNGTTFDYFNKDDEVRETFSITELINLSMCETLVQLEEEVEFYGWVHCFTADDLERIFRVAKKVSYQFTDMWRKEDLDER